MHVSRVLYEGQLLTKDFSAKLNSDDWLIVFYNTLPLGVYL